ncbi:hypothetical protein [Marinomonas shanghaiensis]
MSKQRIRLQAEMEIGSNDAIKHAVISGLGVAVLPKPAFCLNWPCP